MITRPTAKGRLQSGALVLPASAWKPPKVTPIDPDLPKFEAVPVCMGEGRVAPRVAAIPKIVPGANESKIVTLLKDCGRGPLQLSNLRMGGRIVTGCEDRLTVGRKVTPELSEEWGPFSYEVLEGRAGETGITLVPQTIGTQGLSMVLPRSVGSSDGDLAVQATEKATTEIGLVVSFPTGFSKKVTTKGKTTWTNYSANVRVWAQPADGSGRWALKSPLVTVTGRDGDFPFDVAIPHVSLGTSQKWLIGVQLSPPKPEGGANPRATWTSLVSRGPKSLGNLEGHALVAVQFDLAAWGGDPYLHGLTLDYAAELTETVGGTAEATRNPAAAYLDILQGDGNPSPLADARIDSTAISAWATACDTAGLTFDFVFGQDGAQGTILDALRLVGAAGLARPITRDGIYSVIREPSGNPVALFTSANMAPGFRTIRTAFDDALHGLRCTIENRDAAGRRETFIVYASGYSASNATKFEDWTFDGTTTRSAAATIAAYHLGVLTSRGLSYQFGTDWRHLRCQRGDLVRVAHPRIGYGLSWGWVTGVPGARALKVNRVCPMSTGGSYGIRIQNADGTQVTKTVTTHPGEQTTIYTTADHGAAVGDHFAFGVLNAESLSCVVLRVEHGGNLGATLTVAPAGTPVTTGTPWGGPGDPEVLAPPALEVPISYAGGTRYSFL